MVVVGLGLSAISDPVQAELAYITTSSGLAIADTSTNTVLTTLSAINGSGVALSPDGSRAYVAAYPNLIYVVDTASRTVIAQPQVGGVPTTVVVSPDGKWVYASAVTGPDVTVIDTSSNTVARVVPTGLEDTANIGLTSDGKKLFVSAESPVYGSLVVIDTTTFAVTQIPSFALGCVNIAMSPTAPRAYLACGTTLQILDTSANTLVGAIQNLPDVQYGVVSADGKTLYEAARYALTIYVIDLTSNSLHTQVSYNDGAQALGLSADGKTLFVTSESSPIVGEIDTTSLASVGSISLTAGTFSGSIAIPAGAQQFSSFAPKVKLAPRSKAFAFDATFTLAATASALTPRTQSMTLTVGGLTLTIPAGSLQQKDSHGKRYFFAGTINNTRLTVFLEGTNLGPYRLTVKGEDCDLSRTENPLPVALTMGNNNGTANVNPDVRERRQGGRADQDDSPRD
jgi:YVTN family beta-propeller protein